MPCSPSALRLKHSDIQSPPSWAQHFHSNDIDEVRDFVGRRWGFHSRVVRGTGLYRFGQSLLAGKKAATGWVAASLGETIRGASREALLHLAMPAGSEYRVGRRRYVASAGTVTFIAPGWEYTLHRPAGRASAISVDGKQLREEATARMSGACNDLVFRTRSMALGEPAEAKLHAAMARFVESSTAACASSAHGEAALLDALAELLLVESIVVRSQTISAARLADLETWIDAHLERPITVGRLCQVAGVGERALQKAFESRRGMSPMRFVAERRLAVARRLLTVADSNHDVTRVAMSLGFGHTGRFAMLYRQAFGESPSQSRQRATRLGPLAS
jgi:AraC family transcriptional regulator, ethanolamine operon transcriptional activator